MIAPLLDENGKTAVFIGSQMAVQPSGLADGFRQHGEKAMIARLTKRQRQVLALMASVYRNRGIAERLGISEKTVKLHRSLALRSPGAQTSGTQFALQSKLG